MVFLQLKFDQRYFPEVKIRNERQFMESLAFDLRLENRCEFS